MASLRRDAAAHDRDGEVMPAEVNAGWRRLYLLRHGEVAYFGRDGRPVDPWEVGLTAQGRTQAGNLAAALSGRGVELLLTSAVPRAMQTAAILAAGLGISTVVDPGWNELRPGNLAVVSPDRLRAVIVDAYRCAADPGACFFGGEDFGGFARRTGDALDRLLAAPDWSTAVVVTHDPVLRFLVARCLGLGLAGMYFFEQEAGCVHVIEFPWLAGGEASPLIRLLNGGPDDLARLGARGPALDRFYHRYNATRLA